MQSKTPISMLLGFSALLFVGEAFPHALDASGAGFMHGLAHPYLGLDHVLAMLAVGLWASQLGGASCWRVPLAFVTIMTAGSLLATAGSLPFPVEVAIALSVLALGGLIAFSVRVNALWSIAFVSTFAVAHGYAHGLEMPQAATPWGYGLGFVLATASLHGLGVAFGLGLRRWSALLRTSGAAIAVAGLYLLAASQ